MADMYDIGEPESSEADSVSLTSTRESDGDGKEYEVDRILAEDTEDGVTAYLTQWTGYPETRATWQLINTFIEIGDVFKSWEEKKMRISRGYEKAFDVNAWEIRQKQEFQEADRRRGRRARKKARLNRQIDSLSSDPEDKEEARHEEKPKKRMKNLAARASSEPSSEDDDSRFPTRKNLENAAPRASWTNEEQQVFVKGLQEAKGPYWNDILALYGHRGSINRLLQDKSRRDMQMQLEALRNEFTKVGRDPPDYMSLPKPQPGNEAPERSIPTARRHSSVKSHDESDSNDSGTSSDSMLAEIREKNTVKETLEIRHHDEVRKEEMSPTKDSSKPSRNKSTSGSSRSKAFKKENYPSIELSSISKVGPKAASSHPGIPEGDFLPSSKPSSVVKNGSLGERFRPRSIKRPGIRAEPSREPYTGTARATTSKTTTDEPVVPHRSLAGVVGRGPAQLPTSRSKPQASGPPPQSRISGIDVTANWGTVTEPKTRKAVAIPTANAATGSKPPGKLFNLSVRNVVLKGRKKEPAPNLAGVVLLDPKTGRPPKPLPAYPAVTPNKTPFRKFQEELAAKESEERQAKESKKPVVNESDSLFVGISELATEAGNDEQVKDVSGGIVKISSPDASSSPVVERFVKTSKPRSPSPPQPTRKRSQDTGLPPNIPTGPRADTAESVPPTLKADAMDHAVSSLKQAQHLASSLPLTLMGDPTPKERRELWGKTGTDVVYGNIMIGPTLEDLGRMKLLGFGWYVKKLLLANKNRNNPKDMGLDFKDICTAVEYQSYMHGEITEYIGSGYVAPFPEAQERYESVAHLLACHMSAAILFASQFTMVIWPARSSIWGFLENNLPTVPPGAVLRFAIREPMPRRLAEEIEPPMAIRRRLEDLEQSEELKAKINDTPVQVGEDSINVVFRELFDIEFDRLIASNGPQKYPPAKNFFLCFHCANCENYEPNESKRQALRWRASEEHDLFIEFLRANGADMICSMQDIGSYEITKNASWDYFVNNINSGAIIIHDSCGRPDQLPHLAKLLRYQGAINVWKTSLSPMDLETENHRHLVRLFPHGGVICFTSSLILYHPHEALRILRWFRLFHLPSKPSGIWKIAVRPRIREWLLDIQDLSCEESGQTPFGFPLQVYADIYTEICILLTRIEEPFGLMVEMWNSEVPLREAPIISASHLPRGRKEWTGDTFGSAEIDHEAIRWNDEEIIQWFSEWAGLHLDEHRKFHVVLGYPKGHETGDYVTKCYTKGYGYLEHGPGKSGRQELGLFARPSDSAVIKSAWERNFLEIFSYERCFELHNVKDQATLDKAEADRCQKVRDNASRLLSEAEKERQEARQAAKEGLQNLMQMCRDQGGTEEQARAVGRRRLLWKRDEQGTATTKEVEDCAIDMDLVLGNQAGWNHKLIAGTPKERAQAKEEQDRELQRMADKETLSGTQERERLWDAEIEMWASQDRAKQIEDHEMTDVEGPETDLLPHTLYTKILALEPELVNKLTGMLLQLETSQLVALLQDDRKVRAKVKEAKALFLAYITTDEARESGDAEVWPPVLEAYYAAHGKPAAESNLVRKRSGTPSDRSVEDDVVGGGNHAERGVRERKRARE